MITELVDHFRATTTSFRTIALAHSVTPIENLFDETPAAYFYLDSESAETFGMLGLVSQDVTRLVHVFLVARHDQMDTLRTESRVALIGFAPTSHAPMEFSDGRIATINGEWLWWLDAYRTRTAYRQF